VWASIIGLATSRTGRGDYAQDALEAQVAAPAAQTKGNFVRFNLLDKPGPGRADPAMSWYLSPRSIADMKKDVCNSKTIKRSLDELSTLVPNPSATLTADVRKDIDCQLITGQP
jgi:hypothetical protein